MWVRWHNYAARCKPYCHFHLDASVKRLWWRERWESFLTRHHASSQFRPYFRWKPESLDDPRGNKVCFDLLNAGVSGWYQWQDADGDASCLQSAAVHIRLSEFWIHAAYFHLSSFGSDMFPSCFCSSGATRWQLEKFCASNLSHTGVSIELPSVHSSVPQLQEDPYHHDSKKANN